MVKNGFADPGFTLVEMIAVIAILGVLAALGAQVLGRPLMVFTSTATQARFVDMLDLAVDRVSRDVRSALPGSLKVLGSNRLSLERSATPLVHADHGRVSRRARIEYVCGDGELRRAADPEFRSHEQDLHAEGQLLASHVLSCSFELDRDTFSERPVITMHFELGPGGDSPEHYRLVAQARPWRNP